MTNGRAIDTPSIYQIKVLGILDSHWSDWFEGFTITTGESGETILTGKIRDQTALYSLLVRMSNIGLPLLSVSRIGQE